MTSTTLKEQVYDPTEPHKQLEDKSTTPRREPDKATDNIDPQRQDNNNNDKQRYKRTINNKQQQQTTNNQQQTTDTKQSTHNNQHTTNNQQPTYSHHQHQLIRSKLLASKPFKMTFFSRKFGPWRVCEHIHVEPIFVERPLAAVIAGGVLLQLAKLEDNVGWPIASVIGCDVSTARRGWGFVVYVGRRRLIGWFCWCVCCIVFFLYVFV